MDSLHTSSSKSSLRLSRFDLDDHHDDNDDDEKNDNHDDDHDDEDGDGSLSRLLFHLNIVEIVL